MKFILTILAVLTCIVSYSSERYETVNLSKNSSTGGLFAAQSESSVKIRLLDVPTIYELRDEELVSKSVDLAIYEDDVLLGKLLPRQITDGNSESDETNPFAKFDIQDIEIPDYTKLQIDASQLLVGGITNCGEVNTINVVVNQSVYDYLTQLHDISQFDQSYTKYGYEYAAYLRDLDSLDQYHRWEWVKILTENKECVISYIKPQRQYKILAEVRYQQEWDEETFVENLKKAKTFGYDSVLVRFDTTEPYEQMHKIIDLVKDNGFTVFFTYVGLDNQKPAWNPFCDQTKFESFVSEFANYAEGFMLNWRSTSSHVKLLPSEFFNYLCNTYRKYNDKCLIFGEVFYGRVDYLGEVKVVATCPKNISGIVISNMGYCGYNHVYIANKLFKDVIPNYGKMHKIGQVIGYSPYYRSKNPLDISIEAEYTYKKQVEKSFFSANCSTVTLLHDGVDDNYVIDETYDTTDNILVDENFRD